MLCLVARYHDEVLRFAIPLAEARMGFSSQNEITVPFPGVSRLHARLTPTPRGILIRDLGSKNRLIVSGEPRDETELGPGDVVQIGRAFLSIEDGPTSEIENALPTSSKRSESSTGIRDTGSVQDSQSSQSPQAALRVIRAIEAAGSRKLRHQRAFFLGEARAVLGASAIVLFEVNRDSPDISLIALAGDVPDDAAFRVMEESVRVKKRSTILIRSVGETRVLIRVARRSRGMAVIVSESYHLDAWRKDFIEFLAARFLDIDDERVEETPSKELEHLIIPKEMVLGESPTFSKLLAQIGATVRSRMDVLLWGETGTGKELFARMIHDSGPTAGGPFVAINCAAIPSELLEAELFGVQGRVATGVDPREGLFSRADGGSMFLDEVGDLAERLQAKLLRVLQEREVLPLGASRPKKINVRVIATSNKNLTQQTEEGKFRADLYYRLRGLQFHIPPLRERKGDIPPLVLAFVERAASEYRKRIAGVSRKALTLLMSHDWPGNVRELQSEVARAVLLAPPGGMLQVDHFAPVRWAVERMTPADHPTLALDDSVVPTPSDTPPTLQEQLDALERAAIEQALRASGGNKTRAARMLGITRNGLALKLVRLGIS